MSSLSVTPEPLVNPFTESLSVLFAGVLVSLCSQHFASTGAVQKTVAGITQLQKFPVGTISHGRKSTVVSSSSAPRSAIFLKTERGHSLGTSCPLLSCLDCPCTPCSCFFNCKLYTEEILLLLQVPTCPGY